MSDEQSPAAVPTPRGGSPEPSPARSGIAPVVPGPGQRVASRYAVLEMVGRGGVGVVLAAYDARLDRRVALKLLHSHGPEGESGERLLREAQAMARLSHPNVVAVYDAGTLEDGTVFMAMEYVEGGTLREWTRAQARSTREVLEAYGAAGRGLAAAHAVGLVHRDFKPDNVLVGKDGRVRVMDFGLARAERTLAPLPLLPEGMEEAEGPWDTTLTLRGTVVGTPKYMAPELWLGHPADVRSDVYAFCVALYEALYGNPPFAGTHKLRLAAQREGRVAPAPEKTQVPGWLRRVVLSGLEADASKRPEGMEALRRALEDDPGVRRRARLRAVGLGAFAAGLAALLAWGRASQEAARCEHEERHLAGIWDAAVKGRVRRALLETKLSYAPGVAQRVEQALEEYASQWVGMRREVCEAMREQGPSQPRSLVVLEEYCLERRRSQLRALTEVLARSPDPELVQQALQATAALPLLQYCADEKALTASVPPPEDPATRARVAALQPRVDALEALYGAGKYAEGAALAGALAREVEAAGYAPLYARELYVGGLLQDRVGHYAEAEQQLRQAALAAARAKDVETLARAWGQRLFEVGRRLGRGQEAAAMMPQVEDALELVEDDGARASVLVNVGDVLSSQGRYAEAQARLEQAVALWQKALGPAHPYVAYALKMLGNVLIEEGKYAEGRARFEQALSLWQKALGSKHPDVGMSFNNLGNVLVEMGRYDEARAPLEQALAIFEPALGPDHPDLALTLNNLGDTLSGEGRYAEALGHYERALAIRKKAMGALHPRVATSLDYVGGVAFAEGKYAEAQAWFERASAIRERVLAPTHPHVADSLDRLGDVLFVEGRYAEARARYEHALEIREKGQGPQHPAVAATRVSLGRTLGMLRQWDVAEQQLGLALALFERVLGPEHPKVAWALLGWGELRRRQGRPADAVSLLQRALRVDKGARRAEVEWELAQALWEVGGRERGRALAMARDAQLEWRRRGHPRQVEVARWLAAREVR